jgi:hypothetical protein
VLPKTLNFWDVTPCRLICSYRCFKEPRDFQCKTFDEDGIREIVKERRIPKRGQRKGEYKGLKTVKGKGKVVPLQA